MNNPKQEAAKLLGKLGGEARFTATIPARKSRVLTGLGAPPTRHRVGESTMASTKEKIFVVLRGGLVESVFAPNERYDVTVIDDDTEFMDNDELADRDAAICDLQGAQKGGWVVEVL